MKAIKKSICIILALVSLFTFNSCDTEKSISGTKSESDTLYEGTLDIAQYYKDCELNIERARANYCDKRYSVTGIIDDIDSNEVSVLVEDYVSGCDSDLVFVFKPNNDEDILLLSKGQKVTATGTLYEITGITDWHG